MTNEVVKIYKINRIECGRCSKWESSAEPGSLERLFLADSEQGAASSRASSLPLWAVWLHSESSTEKKPSGTTRHQRAVWLGLGIELTSKCHGRISWVLGGAAVRAGLEARRCPRTGGASRGCANRSGGAGTGCLAVILFRFEGRTKRNFVHPTGSCEVCFKMSISSVWLLLRQTGRSSFPSSRPHLLPVVILGVDSFQILIALQYNLKK